MNGKDMLVEIFVSNEDDEEGSIATGYPVAPNKILTARHALFPEDGSGRPDKIEVRWHYLKDLGDAYDWQPATIFECGLDDALDVAVLECRFPENIRIDCYLLSKNPSKQLEWESEGFPRVGKRDEYRKAVDLWGTVAKAADNRDELTVDIEASVAEGALWKGASGSPVFWKDTDTIVGIVCSCPENFNAARFDATPTWKLLAHDGFRNAIDHGRRSLEKERIRTEIAAMLSLPPDLCAALSVGLEIRNASDNDSEQEALANTLVNHLSIDALLRHCEAVLDRLKKQNKTAAATAVRDLIYHLLR